MVPIPVYGPGILHECVANPLYVETLAVGVPGNGDGIEATGKLLILPVSEQKARCGLAQARLLRGSDALQRRAKVVIAAKADLHEDEALTVVVHDQIDLALTTTVIALNQGQAAADKIACHLALDALPKIACRLLPAIKPFPEPFHVDAAKT